MAMVDEWNEQINIKSSGLQQLRLEPLDSSDTPLFSVDQRADFLSQ